MPETTTRRLPPAPRQVEPAPRRPLIDRRDDTGDDTRDTELLRRIAAARRRFEAGTVAGLWTQDMTPGEIAAARRIELGDRGGRSQ